jgi:hypothetical protein
MDESDLILEFMKISKCSRVDAISCLSAWGYDLKKALIDYNGKPLAQKKKLIALLIATILHRHINTKLLQD